MSAISYGYTFFLRLGSLLLLSSFLAPSPLQSEARPAILKGLRLMPLRFDFPQPDYIKLPYSGTLLQIRDPELPLVNISLYFPNGIRNEPLSRAGFLGAALDLLKKGGSKANKGSDLSAALTRLGASLSFHKGVDSWGVSLKVLRQRFEEAFGLLTELLLEPALPESQLRDIKNLLLVEIQQRNERPDRIARRRLRELLYPGLRRGYSLEKEDVARISQAGIARELRRRINPEGMYVTASGDIEGLELMKHLKPLLAALRQRVLAKPLPKTVFDRKALAQRNALYHGKILLVTKAAVQTAIQIGAYLPAHNHSDLYALQVANYVLGGGSFTSRLARKVRVEQGLAYYVYSYNSFGAQDGFFNASCGTHSPKSPRALSLVLQEIAAMKAGLKATEFKLARESILNGLIFQFDTAQKILDQEVRFRLHRLPQDYLQNFSARIRAVSAKDVTDITRYWQPQDLYVVVVGPADLKEKLQKIRPVIVKKPDEKLF